MTIIWWLIGIILMLLVIVLALAAFLGGVLVVFVLRALKWYRGTKQGWAGYKE